MQKPENQNNHLKKFLDKIKAIREDKTMSTKDKIKALSEMNKNVENSKNKSNEEN